MVYLPELCDFLYSSLNVYFGQKTMLSSAIIIILQRQPHSSLKDLHYSKKQQNTVVVDNFWLTSNYGIILLPSISVPQICFFPKSNFLTWTYPYLSSFLTLQNTLKFKVLTWIHAQAGCWVRSGRTWLLIIWSVWVKGRGLWLHDLTSL